MKIAKIELAAQIMLQIATISKIELGTDCVEIYTRLICIFLVNASKQNYKVTCELLLTIVCLIF